MVLGWRPLGGFCFLSSFESLFLRPLVGLPLVDPRLVFALLGGFSVSSVFSLSFQCFSVDKVMGPTVYYFSYCNLVTA